MPKLAAPPKAALPKNGKASLAAGNNAANGNPFPNCFFFFFILSC